VDRRPRKARLRAPSDQNGVAGDIDRLEPRRQTGANGSPASVERGAIIGIENLGPQIGVLAGGINQPRRTELEMPGPVGEARYTGGM